MIFGPERGEIGPINAALRCIGVVRGAARDEFEAVGLDKFRRMDSFPEADKYEEE
jgi:hypothetical protein